MGGALFVSGKKWIDARGETIARNTRPEKARYTSDVDDEPDAIEEIRRSAFML